MPSGTNKLRILVADDHELVRRGIRGLLRARRGWKVIGEAANGREAVEKANILKPDVAIVDISMPDLDGLQATRQIREASPTTKVVVLTMHESDQMVRRVLDAGALAYVLKSDLATHLVRAVKVVSAGQQFLTPRISDLVLKSFLKTGDQPDPAGHWQARPTPREVEIIRLLAEGNANKEVAARLGITVRTVETHRAKIMLKLGLHSFRTHSLCHPPQDNFRAESIGLAAPPAPVGRASAPPCISSTQPLVRSLHLSGRPFPLKDLLMTLHLAQINIARLIAPLDDPKIAGFVSQLEPINALADRAPGFVWRLKSESGNATDIAYSDDPFIIVNMSVWESIEALRDYAYRSDHRKVFQDRARWFEKMDKPNYCLWWVPAGHLPTVTEGRERLEHYQLDGATPYSFWFSQRFPQPTDEGVCV